MQQMADASTTAQVHPEKLTRTFLEEASKAGTCVHIGTVEGITFADDKQANGLFFRPHSNSETLVCMLSDCTSLYC